MKLTRLVGIVLLTSACLSTARGDEPILRLETGGHSNNCNWLGFTPDGQELVSAGSDKVIRVWNVSDPSHPVLDRSLRIQIGDGLTGIIISAAIAPEGDVIAVAGMFPGDAFLLIDLHSGQVLSRVSGHEHPVRSISFSDDGRYLATSGDDLAIAICDVQAWRRSGKTQLPAITVSGLPQGVFNSTFVGKGNNLRLIATLFDGTCRIWRLSGGVWVAERILNAGDTVFTLLTPSPTGQSFAVTCFNQQVKVVSTSGQVLRTFGTANRAPASLLPATAYTPDGQSLVYGFPSSFGLGGSVVFDIASGGGQSRFTEHDNTILFATTNPVSGRNGPLVASTGGDANEIYLWNAQTGQRVGSIIGRGHSVFAIAVDPTGQQFAYGQVNAHDTSINVDHPLTHIFDLDGFIPSGSVADSWTTWSRRLETENGWSARPSETEVGVVTISQNGRAISRLSEPEGGRVLCYTFLPGGRSIVVGYDFKLAMYDTQTGRKTKEFVGHESTVWSAAVSADGKTLFSASADQTIRLWDLEAGTDRSGAVSSLLNFFMTTDAADWIAWTNEGYYTGSPGADELIGWHLNRGDDQQAEFAAAWQYAQVFRRPDIVSRVMETRSTNEALRQATQDPNYEATGPINVASNQDDLAIPDVEIAFPADGSRVESATLRVSGTVRPQGTLPITDVVVLVNGRPASRTRGFGVRPKSEPSGESAVPVPFDVEVGLVDGLNRIEVIAKTKYSTSQPQAISVMRESSVMIRPKLYVLGIGVAQYAEADLALSFPDDDVRQLTSVLEEQEGKLYSKVVVNQLIDEEVTDRNIRRALAQLRRDVTQHDVAIVIVSGHGDLADGQYYFCPHDHDPTETAVFGIGFNDLIEPLAMIPGKVLLLLDTCHAAGVLGPTNGRRAKATRSAVDRAVAEMISVDSGMVVMASSSGHQTSVEDDAWGHGAFALALIEALSGVRQEGLSSQLTLPCDLNGDDILELTEIDAYVTARVKELTGGRQQPITERGRIPSFPIAVAR